MQDRINFSASRQAKAQTWNMKNKKSLKSYQLIGIGRITNYGNDKMNAPIVYHLEYAAFR